MKNFAGKELKMGCMLAPIYVPLGIVIVYLITALFMWSFNDAFLLTLFSIICTAGLSLIILLPIWYAVGYIAIIPLRLILMTAGININLPGSKKSEATQQEQQPKSALSKDQVALINYIKKALTKGLSKEQISVTLKSNGWPRDSITSAFQMVEN